VSYQPTRRQLAPLDPDAVAPFLTWSQMMAYLQGAGPDGSQRFQQGDHVAIIGPTGTGKTHMALEIAEIRTYVMVVACKPRDPLIEDTVRRGYYLIPGNKLEVPYADGVPVHKRVVYWPRLGRGRGKKPLPAHELLKAERALQKPLIGGALGYVRRNGKWCIVIDEGTWVCRDLNLQRDIDSALTQFRTLQASVVILGQRPAWMGRYVLSQPQHLFLFQTSNGEDLKSLGDISGTDTKLVQHIVRELDADKHESLYISTRERKMFRTIARPR